MSYLVVDSRRRWRVPSERVQGLAVYKAGVDENTPVFSLLQFTDSVM
jgi:hypothetical protein